MSYICLYILKVHSKAFQKIHLEDFRLLLKKEWLSSELIDFLVNYLKPLRLSTYVSCALSTLTLDGNVVEAEVWSRFDFKKKYVLIPYNDRGNHFVCFVVNNEANEILFFDSKPGEMRSLTTMKKLFDNFSVSSRNFNWLNYSMEKGPWETQQQDSHNCGTFVVFTLRQIDDEGTFPTDGIEAEELRQSYARAILRISDDMSHLCRYCGHGEREDGEHWVRCDSCDRWIHISCTKIQKDAETWGRSGFVCYFCLCYDENYNEWKPYFLLINAFQHYTLVLMVVKWRFWS